MFRREENPLFFDIVCYALRDNETSQNGEQAGEALYNKLKETQVVDDTLLENTTMLKLRVMHNDNMTLDGIQHFVNLRDFRAEGLHEGDAVRRALKQGCKTTEEGKEKSKKIFATRQISDISALYSLKKLKTLVLNDQRLIKEIDVSYFPELEQLIMQRCTSLTTIKGLDEVSPLMWATQSVELIPNLRYDFSGCINLTKVDGFRNILISATQSPPRTVYPFLHFPLETYIRFSHNEINRSLMNAYVNYIQYDGNKDIFSWRENSNNMAPVGMTTTQIGMLKNRMDNILATICDPNNKPMQNIYNIYQYITQNVQYDRESLDILHQTITPEIKDSYSQTARNIKDHTITAKHLWEDGERLPGSAPLEILSDNMYQRAVEAGSTRSSFTALFNQKAVCAGVSNLFNALVTDFGYKAFPCLCWSRHRDDPCIYDVPNHQISVISIRSSDNKVGNFFFDPTFDLGKEKLTHFAMNMEEMPANYVLAPRYDGEGKDAFPIRPFMDGFEKNSYSARCARANQEWQAQQQAFAEQNGQPAEQSGQNPLQNPQNGQLVGQNGQATGQGGQSSNGDLYSAGQAGQTVPVQQNDTQMER